jgi:hypothetical protein
MQELLITDYESAKNDYLCFPNKASEAQVKKMPKAVLLTTEFDALNRCAKEAAEIY